eukprot:TRINITY_DN63265_c0_g1_i1.p1 TRINITY_DN63265_c0_g1~~TRINITY_DN63265_c0_g1_i1.p1  ORF type:complete len:565 (-),score=127.67 TRINITY_DN63265_c0_g1_i1:590-2284(-)
MNEGVSDGDEKKESQILEFVDGQPSPRLRELVKEMSLDWQELSKHPMILKIANAHRAKQHYVATVRRLEEAFKSCEEHFKSVPIKNEIQLGSGSLGLIGSGFNIGALAAAVPTAGGSLSLLIPGAVCSALAGGGGLCSFFLDDSKFRESSETLNESYKAFFIALEDLFKRVHHAKFLLKKSHLPQAFAAMDCFTGSDFYNSSYFLSGAGLISASAGIGIKVAAAVEKLGGVVKSAVVAEKASGVAAKMAFTAKKAVVSAKVLASGKAVAATASKASMLSPLLRIGGITLCGFCVVLDFVSIVESAMKLTDKKKMKEKLLELDNVIKYCLKDEDAKILLESNEATALVENCLTHADLLLTLEKSASLVCASGSSANIWFATYKGEQVAIKAFKTDAEVHANPERELEIVQSLRHPNVIAYKDSFKDARGRSYMVFEFCSGGTLHDWLHEYPKDPLFREQVQPLTWVARYVAFLELFGALTYLHSKNIIHGDVKPANLGFNYLGSLKLLDFGLSRSSTALLQNQGQSMSWTPSYVPAWFSTSPRVHTALDVDVLELSFSRRCSEPP